MLSVLLLLALSCGLSAANGAFDLQRDTYPEPDAFCDQDMKFKRHKTDCTKAYLCYKALAYEVKCKGGKYFRNNGDAVMNWGASDMYCVTANACDFQVELRITDEGSGRKGLKCTGKSADASQEFVYTYKWTKDGVSVRNAERTRNGESVLSYTKVETGNYRCEAESPYVGSKSKTIHYQAPPPTPIKNPFDPAISLSFRQNNAIPAGFDVLLARDFGKDPTKMVTLQNKMNGIITEMEAYRGFLVNLKSFLETSTIGRMGAKFMFDNMIVQWEQKTEQWQNYLMNRGVPVNAGIIDYPAMCSNIVSDGRANDAWSEADYNANKAMCACRYMTQGVVLKSSGCSNPTPDRGLQNAVEDAIAWELDMINAIKDDIVKNDYADYQTLAFFDADMPIRQQMVDDLKVFSNRLRAATTAADYIVTAPEVDLDMRPLHRVNP